MIPNANIDYSTGNLFLSEILDWNHVQTDELVSKYRNFCRDILRSAYLLKNI